MSHYFNKIMYQRILMIVLVYITNSDSITSLLLCIYMFNIKKYEIAISLALCWVVTKSGSSQSAQQLY